MFVFRTIILGSIFLVAVLVLGPWVAVQFDQSFPVLTLGKVKFVGIFLMFLGIPLAIYCLAVLFVPGKSRPAPYDAGGIFTIAGPYCYVRNPFMLAVIMTLWGEALLLSRMVMIVYSLIFTWCIHFWVVFYEEPTLSERFGREYKVYLNSVPRWLPHFRKYQA